MPVKPQIYEASDRSVLVSFGDTISEEARLDIWRFTTRLLQQRASSITNIHPAYCSVLVEFDPLHTDSSRVQAWCQEILEHLLEIPLPAERVIEVPVLYGGEFGPDLEAVASFHSLSVEETIRLHASSEYRVHFLGFSPGFAYLGGLPPQLATPRRPTPRRIVPAGSVAIGGNQTGIYPVATPGGWHIIGRTPLTLFDPSRNPPTLLAMGDRVRFRPVTVTDFDAAGP